MKRYIPVLGISFFVVSAPAVVETEPVEVIVKTNELFGQVRFLKLDGKEYAVASDVAKALGYKDVTNAIKRHCEGVAKHHLPHPQSKIKTMEVNIIPEGDIYRLIFGSSLPSAKKFERWVMDEVVPQIRATGGYINVDISF